MMEFGTLVMPHPGRAVEDTKYAEERGFAQAWFTDSHMIYGDAYACMALAAAKTRRIRLGTGVSVASNRIPPVTVHSIATVNEIAPGRVWLGYGTGHTGRRVMGLPPVRFAEFREQVRVIHDLLKTGEAIYNTEGLGGNTEGLSRKIRFLHRDRRFINLDDPIPLYVAANAPKARRLAGEYGDGLITSRISDPARMEAIFKEVNEGARAAGRTFPEGRISFPCVSLTHICVLRPGEKLDSPRVVEMTGHWVAAALHGVAAGFTSMLAIPADARPVFEAYADYVRRMEVPADQLHLHLHQGHVIYLLPEERRFITPAAIRSTTLVGTRPEILDLIRGLERAGVNQLVVNPPMDHFRECLDEIASELIEHL
jgi:alkanesulfonate monooxygenase SsuD/methylene tetrahydromethanopterin reductase-like flavin-dependent oxidoreductase (luciferase family)